MASEPVAGVKERLTQLLSSTFMVLMGKNGVNAVFAPTSPSVSPVQGVQEKARNDCVKRLQNLLTLKTSPANTDGSLLSDEEYAVRRADLIREKARLEAAIASGTDPLAHAVTQVTSTLLFVRRLRERFAEGSPDLKRTLVAGVGLNLTLKAKTLYIEPLIPFSMVREAATQLPADSGWFEPGKRVAGQGKTAASATALPVGCG